LLGGNTSVIYEESARIYRLAENWREWVKRVAKAVSKIGCKVFVFGSRVEGKASPSSDVDVLIVCRKLPKSAFERARIKARIEEEAVGGIMAASETLFVAEELVSITLIFLG